MHTNIQLSKGSSVIGSPADHANTVGSLRSPELSPLSRYVPSANKSFLVEEHRLTDSEKVTQKVSSILPWMFLGLFAVSPFLMMKYNLGRFSSHQKDAVTVDNTRTIISRHTFGVYTTADIPELLARRTPTLICFVSENYHSRVVAKLFEEIDAIFNHFGVKVNVALVRMTSIDDPNMVAVAPHCQLLVPKGGDGEVYSFSGLWNLEQIIRFVLPDTKISSPMAQSIHAAHERLARTQKTMFKTHFVDPR